MNSFAQGLLLKQRHKKWPIVLATSTTQTQTGFKMKMLNSDIKLIWSPKSQLYWVGFFFQMQQKYKEPPEITIIFN